MRCTLKIITSLNFLEKYPSFIFTYITYHKYHIYNKYIYHVYLNLQKLLVIINFPVKWFFLQLSIYHIYYTSFGQIHSSAGRGKNVKGRHLQLSEPQGRSNNLQNNLWWLHLISVRYLSGCLTWWQWFFLLRKQASCTLWATQSHGWDSSRYVGSTLPSFPMNIESEGVLETI